MSSLYVYVSFSCSGTELLNSKANLDPLKYITFGKWPVSSDLISSSCKFFEFQPVAYSSPFTFSNVNGLANGW